MNLRLLCGTMIIALVGCTSNNVGKRYSSALIYLFDDASFSNGPGTDYYYNGDECFVVVFGEGYTKPIIWYHISSLSASIVSEFNLIIKSKGLPMQQEGGFRKFAYVKGFSKATSEQFDQETAEIAKCFDRLRKALVLDKYKTTTIPNWISSAENINKDYGLR